MIEQGGSSLYTAMSLKATDLEVLRIVVSIGGTEVNHFAVWHDKAGNAVAQPLAGVKDPETGVTFPDLNSPPFGGELFQTNLIMRPPSPSADGTRRCAPSPEPWHPTGVRRFALALGTAGAVLALAAPAGAATPTIPQPERGQIRTLLKAFIPAAIGRHHPGRAWALAAPKMRVGSRSPAPSSRACASP